MTLFTPVYQFPSPELLVGAADGPAAFLALAQRMESQMPTLRSQSYSLTDTVRNFGGNQSGVLLGQWTIPTAVNGWIEVDFNVDFMPNVAGVSCIGGTVSLRLDSGASVVTFRIHNECQDQAKGSISGTCAKALTGSTTSVNAQIFVSMDATSAAISFRRWQFTQRQYGAPA